MTNDGKATLAGGGAGLSWILFAANKFFGWGLPEGLIISVAGTLTSLLGYLANRKDK